MNRRSFIALTAILPTSIRRLFEPHPLVPRNPTESVTVEVVHGLGEVYLQAHNELPPRAGSFVYVGDNGLVTAVPPSSRIGHATPIGVFVGSLNDRWKVRMPGWSAHYAGATE